MTWTVAFLALVALGPVGDVVPLPLELEVALARSALPTHLRDDATVYVYAPGEGYRVAVDGSNGFHALVGRDDPAVRWATFEYEEYPTDFLIPVAFDEAGSGAQLAAYLDLGRWRAQGVPAPEAQARLRARFQDGAYPAPARAGIAYMLSPILRSFLRTERDDAVRTFSAPHYMIYAPGVTDDHLGNSPDLRQPVMRPSMPDPHGMIVIAAGHAERETYRSEHQGLLDELCTLHEPWCMR